MSKKNKMSKKFKLTLLVLAILVAATATIAILLGNGGTKPIAVTGEVSADSTLINSFKTNSKRYTSILPDMYGFSAAQAKSVLNDKGEWMAYNLDVTVNNDTDEDITIYSVDIKDNGNKNVWISTVTNGEIGIGKGNKDIVSISVLVNDKNMTEENAAKAIKNFKLKLVYSKTPTTSSSGADSIEEKKTMNVD